MLATIRNSVTLVLVLTVSCLARDDKAMATELLAKAWKASDIRTEAAPAFRLEASFKITDASKKELAGRYTEIWISKAKWRREVEAGTSHYVEIGVGTLKWSSNANDFVEQNLHRALTLLFADTVHETLEVKGASELQVGGIRAVCVQSKSEWSKNTDCIDPGTGTFVRRENTAKSGTLISCNYGNYEKLGDRTFPRAIRCSETSGRIVELTVSRITPDVAADEQLFTKPDGAIETANCQGRMKAPRLIHDPEPKYPAGHSETQLVVLSLVIDTEGKPQDIRVNGSGGRDFDQAAIAAVASWKFKPPTCDAQPVPAKISVQVNFRQP